VFFINGNDLACCPNVIFSIESRISASALLDTGRDTNTLTQKLYDQLTEAGVSVPTLPPDNVALITAFGRRTAGPHYIFFVDEDRFDAIFLISTQLINSNILGSSFTKEYGSTIDFVTKCLYYEKDGSRREHSFDRSFGSLKSRNNEQELKGDASHNCFSCHPGPNHPNYRE
jgi:hypothetical protein